MMVEIGQTVSFERVFTKEEVSQFAEISGDKAVQHMVEDDQGRLMVHGLLTATLPTKTGGEMDLLANKITYNFKRPVYTGDRIECVSTVTDIERVKEGRLDIKGVFECQNQDGDVVLIGDFGGVLFE